MDNIQEENSEPKVRRVAYSPLTSVSLQKQCRELFNNKKPPLSNIKEILNNIKEVREEGYSYIPIEEWQDLEENINLMKIAKNFKIKEAKVSSEEYSLNKRKKKQYIY